MYGISPWKAANEIEYKEAGLDADKNFYDFKFDWFLGGKPTVIGVQTASVSNLHLIASS